jgi:hypothetical protein
MCRLDGVKIMSDNSKAKYSIGEKVEATVIRNETNFDKACDSAYRLAISIFGIDEFGHFNNVKNANRNSAYLAVTFKSYKHTGSMSGQEMVYTFEAVVLNCEEE